MIDSGEKDHIGPLGETVKIGGDRLGSPEHQRKAAKWTTPAAAKTQMTGDFLLTESFPDIG